MTTSRVENPCRVGRDKRKSTKGQHRRLFALNVSLEDFFCKTVLTAHDAQHEVVSTYLLVAHSVRFLRRPHQRLFAFFRKREVAAKSDLLEGWCVRSNLFADRFNRCSRKTFGESAVYSH